MAALSMITASPLRLLPLYISFSPEIIECSKSYDGEKSWSSLNHQYSLPPPFFSSKAVQDADQGQHSSLVLLAEVGERSD